MSDPEPDDERIPQDSEQVDPTPGLPSPAEDPDAVFDHPLEPTDEPELEADTEDDE